MRNYILVALLSIFVLSCNSDDNNVKILNIDSTLILKGDLFGSGEEGIVEQNIVITNENAWNNLITQMNSVNIVSNNFSEIDVNFSDYTVIAVFDEIKGNGGHDLELGITSNSENIVVNITDLAPEGNATTVITQPFIIVKISNSSLPIIFE